MFSKYNDIENSYNKKELSKFPTEGFRQYFLVTEKLHGCVKFDSIISTLEYGDLKISDIVDNELKCKVKSYNEENFEITYENVINFYKKEDDCVWYEIVDEEGNILYITEEHPVYIPELKCYRKVKDLKENDTILVD